MKIPVRFPPGFRRTPAVLALIIMTLWQLGCDRPQRDVANEANSSASSSPAGSLTAAPVPLTNMVLIKAGTYMRIKFPVTITRDFWLGKFEVTQAEYEAVIGRNPSHFPDPERPVEKVTFNDAMAYCAAVTRREREAGRLIAGWEYRLPTEAEWEYACRAGSTNRFSFGDEAAGAAQFAWTQENSGGTSHRVGQRKPNAWGLHDMHGNVWEWCLDWFEPYPPGKLTDPTGPSQAKYKVFRGGGWNNEIDMARCSNRFMMEPANGIHFVGFRIALCQSRP